MEARPRYFWLSFVAMVLFGIANTVFSYLNWTERASMHREQQMTRTMLNARAIIQMTLVQAASEGRPLTADEERQINRLWIAAEYDIDKRPE